MTAILEINLTDPEIAKPLTDAIKKIAKGSFKLESLEWTQNIPSGLK
ncbi:MAG: hypothetical protein ABSE15_00410 [Candidatus Bathyarchaeia archaeon]|jgi:hypothetical protein